MEMKYFHYGTEAPREAGPENMTQDHRAGTWRHEGMSAFPPDWPQFLSKICEIRLDVDVRSREGVVTTKEREHAA